MQDSHRTLAVQFLEEKAEESQDMQPPHAATLCLKTEAQWCSSAAGYCQVKTEFTT